MRPAFCGHQLPPRTPDVVVGEDAGIPLQDGAGLALPGPTVERPALGDSPMTGHSGTMSISDI